MQFALIFVLSFGLALAAPQGERAQGNNGTDPEELVIRLVLHVKKSSDGTQLVVDLEKSQESSQVVRPKSPSLLSVTTAWGTKPTNSPNLADKSVAVENSRPPTRNFTQQSNIEVITHTVAEPGYKTYSSPHPGTYDQDQREDAIKKGDGRIEEQRPKDDGSTSSGFGIRNPERYDVSDSEEISSANSEGQNPVRTVVRNPDIRTSERPHIRNPERPDIRNERPDIRNPERPNLKNPERPNLKNPEQFDIRNERPDIRNPEQSHLRNPERPDKRNPVQPEIYTSERPYIRNPEQPDIGNERPDIRNERPDIRNPEKPDTRNERPDMRNPEQRPFLRNPEQPEIRSSEKPYIRNPSPQYSRPSFDFKISVGSSTTKSDQTKIHFPTSATQRTPGPWTKSPQTFLESTTTSLRPTTEENRRTYFTSTEFSHYDNWKSTEGDRFQQSTWLEGDSDGALVNNTQLEEQGNTTEVHHTSSESTEEGLAIDLVDKAVADQGFGVLASRCATFAPGLVSDGAGGCTQPVVRPKNKNYQSPTYTYRSAAGNELHSDVKNVHLEDQEPSEDNGVTPQVTLV